MTLPSPIVELFINGAWTDLTALRRIRTTDNVVIDRGLPDEVSKAQPSICGFTADNRNGDLSPRNPTGAYYGQIGRNTRMRVRVTPASPGYLRTNTSDGTAGATTPDSANLSITGDIDIRVDVRPDQWGQRANLAHKYNSTGNQRSWFFQINANNTLSLLWSPDGTFGALILKTSTVAITPPASGRLAVRATLDVDNGAAGNDVKFYTSDSINGTWTQLGATVTTAGTTSIFDSTALVGIGAGEGTGIVGRIYAFKLFQGIAGTLRADVNMSDEDAGATSFADGQSNTWTVLTDASIVTPAVRFQGEISEWPQRWDVSGRNVYVPMQASGILRRFGQGASPLKSALYRGYTSLATPVKAYWPCEDGGDATSFASPLGGPPMRVRIGAPAFAQFTDFKCSEALPTLANSEWVGTVPAHTATGNVQVWHLLHIPTGAAAFPQEIINISTTGTAPLWRLLYGAANGDLTLQAFDTDLTLLFTNTAGFAVNDKLLRVDIELKQNGANIDWAVATLEVGQSAGTVNSGTLNSQTVGRCHTIRVNQTGDLGADIAIGHISVDSTIRSIFDLYQELNAYSGEPAGRRVQRLCGEEGIAFRAVGDPDASTLMGPQLPKALVELLQEAADADTGILYEPRDLFGLAYRSKESMYRQTAALPLVYTSGHISAMEPTDDDQHVRNDITVQRDGGSSFRAVQSSGPLSVAAPPSGVGRYDEQITLSLANDGLIADQAGWRLRLGTVDEARYPVLSMELARPVFVSNQTLSLAAQDLDVGDRATVDNPPAWLPPDDISQLALGMVETMGSATRRIDVNCSPESPWGQVAIYDDSLSRYTSDGSTLASGVNSSATSLSVATSSGPLWSHADGDFQIRVGGEVMTVTAVTGASSPQTFTVTRSVNGVVKAQSSGAEVALELTRVYVP